MVERDIDLLVILNLPHFYLPLEAFVSEKSKHLVADSGLLGLTKHSHLALLSSLLFPFDL
jgi:hypothetical protein